MFFLFKKEYDYALRICAFLAGLENNNPVAIRQLAEKLLISKPFTTKIVYKLKSKNILKTKQGKAGGVYLNHNPESLSIFSIFAALGLDKTISQCITKKDFCPLPVPCKIHGFFMKEESEMINKLKNKTLDIFSFKESEFK